MSAIPHLADLGFSPIPAEPQKEEDSLGWEGTWRVSQATSAPSKGEFSNSREDALPINAGTEQDFLFFSRHAVGLQSGTFRKVGPNKVMALYNLGIGQILDGPFTAFHASEPGTDCFQNTL